MNFIAWLQTRLDQHGFTPGPIDGLWGRKTLNALRSFQRAAGIPTSGQADTATVDALRKNTFLTPQPEVPAPELNEMFPWMQIANSKKHLRETNPVLKQFLKSDKKTLGDPAKLPWCGDFVETCIALALPNEALPVNPYLARNWLKFGKEPDAPGYGDVLVFKRPGSSWSGHVGFYDGEDDTAFHVLGGNQSNAVTRTRIAKNRLLGARRPLTSPIRHGTTVKLSADGKLSTNEV